MTPSYLPFPQVTRRSSAALPLGALSLYLIEKQPLVHGVVETLPSGHIRTCPLGWWRREASRQAASAPQTALRSRRTATAPLAASRADRPPRSAAPRPCLSLQTGPSGGGGSTWIRPAGTVVPSPVAVSCRPWVCEAAGAFPQWRTVTSITTGPERTSHGGRACAQNERLCLGSEHRGDRRQRRGRRRWQELSTARGAGGTPPARPSDVLCPWELPGCDAAPQPRCPRTSRETQILTQSLARRRPSWSRRKNQGQTHPEHV